MAYHRNNGHNGNFNIPTFEQFQKSRIYDANVNGYVYCIRPMFIIYNTERAQITAHYNDEKESLMCACDIVDDDVKTAFDKATKRLSKILIMENGEGK